tara:strand:+ start:5392 stop:6687 length:1296 start_codon:yes stop_codon:yes gene_type:complete
MKTIPITDVVIPDFRQRKTFDEAAMAEFADNIAKTQLQNAIVLRADNTLVSGERRLRAIRDLAGLEISIKHDGEEVPLGCIPYTRLESLDPLAAEEAELDENLHRVNLTWQERAAAHSRLQSLRIAQAIARGESPPTVADIATELRGSAIGDYQTITKQELILAKHLDRPEIAGATSPKEAFKILKKLEDTERNRIHGESIGRTYSSDALRCLNTDSLAWMKECPAEQFDVILTDPPYGMGADEFGDSGGLAQGAHGYADTADFAMKCFTTLATEGFRITKPQAHIYAFCDIELFPVWKKLFELEGWWVFRTPLIWHKPAAMRAPWPEHGPQRKYEVCLYAVKGKRPVLKMAPDLFAYSPDTNLGHAAQKPVALFEDLLKRSVNAGDSILDPFCGSGPIFPAAFGLKCKATGIEQDTASYGIAVKRIATLK